MWNSVIVSGFLDCNGILQWEKTNNTHFHIQNNYTNRERRNSSKRNWGFEWSIRNSEKFGKREPTKHPIGRPRKSSILLQPQPIKKKKECDEEHKWNNQHKRKRWLYNKWFTKDLFRSIERVVKGYGRNTNAVNYLKLAFKTPHAPSSYEKLSRISLWNWFDDKGGLRPNFIEASELRHHVKHQKQNLHVLENHLHVRNQLVSKLKKLRKRGQILLLSIIQRILGGMIEAVGPELKDDIPGGFYVSVKWIREFVKFYMNWTFCKGTTVNYSCK